jgi:hypothetical protein
MAALLALTENENVALFGSLGLVAVAVISSIPGLLARGQAKRAADAVGERNGRGTVVQMVTRVLDGQVHQDERLARLEQGRLENAEAIGVIEGRVAALERHET